MIDLNYRPKIAWRASAIPKKSGGLRYLLIPSDELKKAQHDVLDELYHTKGLKIHNCATGFIPFRNTMTSALKHARDSKLILQLDVHNFFPTFPVQTVMDALKESGMSAAKRDYIYEFCVFHGKHGDQFPQGSPTSPYLTNIGMFETDCMLKACAKHFGYTYTRYADDMSFASIPDLYENNAVTDRKCLVACVARVLDKKLDMSLSWEKTLYAFENSPKVPRRILGVTIRKDHLGYNAPKKLRKRARACVHNLYKALQEGVPKEELWPQYRQMQGLVGYANYIRKHSDWIVSYFDPCIKKHEYDFVRKEFEANAC